MNIFRKFIGVIAVASFVITTAPITPAEAACRRVFPGLIRCVTVTSFSHTKALRFDEAAEYVGNATAQSIGIGNTWTISIWFKTSSFVNYKIPFELLPSSGNANQVRWQLYPTAQPLLDCYGSNGTTEFFRQVGSSLSANTVYNMVATNSNGTLNIYINDAANQAGQSGSASQTDGNRTVYIGSTPTNSGFIGDISRIDVWDTVLSANERTAIYDSGLGYKLDLRNSKGNYVSTSNLKHQWLLGEDASLAQSDYVSSGGINVYTNSSNISSADIVDF